MRDRIEAGGSLPAAERELRQPPPVQLAPGVHQLLSELVGDPPDQRRPWPGKLAGDLVGVYDRRAAFPEELGR
jgi:hypothetical protein